MTEREYRRMLRDAKKRYDADIEAIERVWELSQSTGRAGDSRPSVKHGDLVERVKDAATEMVGEFTAADVKDFLDQHTDLTATKATISRTLRRMETDEPELLHLVNRGSGRTPTRYRSASHEDADESADPGEVVTFG